MENLEYLTKIYGKERQLRQAIEECGELIVAIAKMQRYNENIKTVAALIDEIADVEIMTEQIKILYNLNSAVDFRKEEKVNRQISKLKEEHHE